MHKLKDFLPAFNEKELHAITKTLHIQNTQIPWHTSPKASLILTHQFAKGDFIKSIFEALSPQEKKMMLFMASQGGLLKEQELLSRFPGPSKALTNLKNRFFLIEHPYLKNKVDWTVLMVPWEVFLTLPPKTKEDMSLGQFLNRQTTEILVEMANQYSLQKKVATRAYVILLLRDHILNLENPNELMGSLPKESQEIFEKALNADGILGAKDVGTFEVEKPSYYYSSQTRLPVPLESLFYKGLLFPLPWPAYKPSHYVIPFDVLKNFQKIRPLSATTSTPTATASPRYIRSFGLRLVQDLRLMSAVEMSNRLQKNKNASIERKSMNQFLTAIGVNELNYGNFLGAFIVAIKKNNAPGDGWLDNPTQTFRKLIHEWRNSHWWDETIYSTYGATQDMDSTIVSKRNEILSFLSTLSVHEWVSMETLQQQLPARWQSAEALHLLERLFPQQYIMHTSSNENISATLNDLVWQSLTWLGIVECGHDTNKPQDQTPTTFRLTEWGHFYFHGPEDQDFPHLPPHSPTKQFFLQPNCDVITPPDLAFDILVDLLRIAVLTQSNTCHISQQSILAAIELKWSQKKICEFLKKHSGTGIPESIIRLITDITDKQGGIFLGRNDGYLIVKNMNLMQEIASRKEVQKYLKKIIGNVALYNYHHHAQVEKALKKYGYIPDLEELQDPGL